MAAVVPSDHYGLSADVEFASLVPDAPPTASSTDERRALPDIVAGLPMFLLRPLVSVFHANQRAMRHPHPQLE